jgi:hypothetical protein
MSSWLFEKVLETSFENIHENQLGSRTEKELNPIQCPAVIGLRIARFAHGKRTTRLLVARNS